MHFHIITLFPESFDSYLAESIIGRAIKNKKIKISFYNPRMYVTGKYKKVWPDGNISRVADDRPFGGGPGMVMRAEPVLKAVEAALKKLKINNEKLRIKTKSKIIFFTPSGKKFDTTFAKKTVEKFTDVILICGRYEGIDSRVQKIIKTEDISIGEYVLTGGELPAMIVIDCMSRQIPGVLGNFDSREEERIASPEIYTRPEILEWKGKKYRVPKILLSGDHKKIDAWKQNLKVKRKTNKS